MALPCVLVSVLLSVHISVQPVTVRVGVSLVADLYLIGAFVHHSKST